MTYHRFLLFLLFICIACQSERPEQTGLSALSARGKAVYLANCTTCHASDPTQNGPVGPAVAGSSAELVAARVLQAKYPEGYFPKRSTQIMPAFPQLEKDVQALAAYLNSLK